MPLNKPLSHIVLLASGHDVSDVIIDGKVVMLNRKIITLNEEEVLIEAEKAAYSLFNRTSICRDIDTS